MLYRRELQMPDDFVEGEETKEPDDEEDEWKEDVHVENDEVIEPDGTIFVGTI
jgi:hypothetical protein